MPYLNLNIIQKMRCEEVKTMIINFPVAKKIMNSAMISVLSLIGGVYRVQVGTINRHQSGTYHRITDQVEV